MTAIDLKVLIGKRICVTEKRVLFDGNVKLGNYKVFIKTSEDLKPLADRIKTGEVIRIKTIRGNEE